MHKYLTIDICKNNILNNDFRNKNKRFLVSPPPPRSPEHPCTYISRGNLTLFYIIITCYLKIRRTVFDKLAIITHYTLYNINRNIYNLHSLSIFSRINTGNPIKTIEWH